MVDLSEQNVDKRVLVVGATSGVGRAIAAFAAGQGCRVVAVGRREDRLEQLRSERHGDLETVVGDVRLEEDCHRMVDESVERLGGLDALVYAAGVSPLGRLVDTSAEDWRRVLETNLVGAALVCGRSIPHLEASGGRALFLSSVSTDDPRPMLVHYGASKAALDALIRGWRNEHPHLCFTRVVVGPTVSEFGSDWEPERIAELTEFRAERGLIKSTSMSAEEVAEEVHGALTSPIWVQDVSLMPRNPLSPES